MTAPEPIDPDDALAPGAEFDVEPEPEHEAPVVELVRREPLSDRDVAVMRAANAALEDPTIAGRDEFLSLAMHARMLAMSSVVPKALQGKPHDVMVVLLTGRDLGIPLTAALRKVYVVDGNPTVAPQLIAALVRRKGLGSIKPHADNSSEWAAAVPYGPDGRPIGPPSVFTWRDAQIAGLAGSECTPDSHVVKTQTKQRRDGGSYTVQACGCKDNWRNYPQRMLYARALGYAAADYFPDATLGLYQADELGAVTDEDGRPIDVASVELPAGFESEAEKREMARREAEQAKSPEEREAEEAKRWALQERIAALPEAQAVELRQRWKEHDRLKQYPVRALPANLVRLAEAMLGGFEAAAKQSGWSPVIARTHVQQGIAAVIAGLWGQTTEATGTGSTDSEPESTPDAPGGGDDTPETATGHTDAVSSPTADDVKALIAEVRGMKAAEIDSQLALLDLSRDGNVDQRRQRLAMALMKQRHGVTE